MKVRATPSRGEGPGRRQAEVQRDDHVQPHPASEPGIPRVYGRGGQTHRLSLTGSSVMTETTSATSGPTDVWITGIGLATSLGEGLDANWDALNQGRINVDEKTFAPYMVHPWCHVSLDTQIPKKGDQRQMEAWQRIGTYAAGLALDSAGIKDDKEILARTDMIVAAGGGERDLDVDAAILTARADARSGALNERLMNDLRPTLFLAQLSNLLAGNISIVHGVSGSS